jgi:hypothetical protein
MSFRIGRPINIGCGPHYTGNRCWWATWTMFWWVLELVDQSISDVGPTTLETDVFTTWKTQSRHAHMKNGDTQGHRILYYIVTWDTHPGASMIRIYLRCTLDGVHFPLEINPRCAIKSRVVDLITGWDRCDTNRRHAKRHVSPITKLSEACFMVAYRRFDCRLRPLWH